MLPVTAGHTDVVPVLKYHTGQKEDYRGAWARWRDTSVPGSGELRETAFNRLMACLEYGYDSLDLSDLNLCALPDVFPPLLKYINARCNPLSEQAREDAQAIAGEVQIDIDEPPAEAHALIIGDESGWQDVRAHGRALRLSAEQAAQGCGPRGFIFRPCTLWKAGGVLAGLGVIAAAGTYLHRYFTGSAAAYSAQDLAPLPLAVAGEPQEAINTTQPVLPAEPETANVTLSPSFIHSLMDDAVAKETFAGDIAGWLFPVDDMWEAEHKVVPLARAVLLADRKYGGEEDEALSYRMAKGIVRHRVMTRVVGTTLRDYLAGEILAGAHDSDSGYLQGLKNLRVEDFLDIDCLAAAQRASLRAMWHQYLRDEIPLLGGGVFNRAVTLALTDYEFMALCAGSDYLAEQGILENFNATEVIGTGSALWGQVLSGEAATEMLPYLLTPALWYVARVAPELVDLSTQDYAQTVVPFVLDRWREAQAQAQELERRSRAYQQALAAWSSKGALAERLIAGCSLADLSLVRSPRDESIWLPESVLVAQKKRAAVQRYLQNDAFVCDQATLPPLSAEYTRRTRAVGDTFAGLDRLLMTAAFSAVEKTEADYLFSSRSKAHPARLLLYQMTPYRETLFIPLAPEVVFPGLKNTDLFIVRKGSEERFYGLKRGEQINSGYRLHRLDMTDQGAVNNALYRYQHFRAFTPGEIQGILVAGEPYILRREVNLPRCWSLDAEGGGETVIDALSERHREHYYQTLLDSGNTLSDLEQLWSVVKQVIPFYSCVEGLASGNSQQALQAIPACVLDALASAVVAGRAVALSGKFGLGLVQGVRSGVLNASRGTLVTGLRQSVAKNVALPTSQEIKAVLKEVLRVWDPGTELLYRGGVGAGRLVSRVQDSALAKKLKSYLPLYTRPPVTYQKARLPDGGPEVCVKPVGGDRWVQVNPETGEAWGRYYFMGKGESAGTQVRQIKSEDQQASGSAAAVPQPIPAAPVPPGYNQLPPAARRHHYWNRIRKAVKGPIPMELFEQKNTHIQKLTAFLPAPQLYYYDVDDVTPIITDALTKVYKNTPWRAWEYSSGEISDDEPVYIRMIMNEIGKYIKKSEADFRKAGEKLQSIVITENFHETEFGRYLFGLLKTTRQDVLEAAVLRIKKVVADGNAFFTGAAKINYENFIIVSTDLIPDTQSPYGFKPAINTASFDSVPYAQVNVCDPEVRIFISVDRFLADLSNDVGRRGSLFPTTVTHEVTHIASATQDMFNYFHPLPGDKFNVAMLKWVFTQNFILKKTEDEFPIIYNVRDFKKYIKRLQVEQGVPGDLDKSDIFNAIFEDEFLCANILLEDAEVLSYIIRDLAEGNTADVDINFER